MLAVVSFTSRFGVTTTHTGGNSTESSMSHALAHSRWARSQPATSGAIGSWASPLKNSTERSAPARLAPPGHGPQPKPGRKGVSKPSIQSDPFPSGEILLDDPPPDLRETAMRIVSAEAWRRRPGVITVDRLFINPPAERSIPTRDAYAIGKTSIGTLRGEQPVGRFPLGIRTRAIR